MGSKSASKKWRLKNISKVREYQKSYKRRPEVKKRHREESKRYYWSHRDERAAYRKRHSRTIHGFLVFRYWDIIKRVRGNTKDRKLYAGKPVMDKSTFLEWSKSDEEFNRLFRAWVRGGYKHTSMPSINRIDSRLGYTPGNVSWVSLHVNAYMGAVNSVAARRHKSARLQCIERLLHAA